MYCKKSTRIIEQPRVKRMSNNVKTIDNEKSRDDYDDEIESNNDVRDFIKKCVQEELQTISKKASRQIPHVAEKQKKLINHEKICDCGIDIGKMSHQQIEMHMRSKYHNENI